MIEFIFFIFFSLLMIYLVVCITFAILVCIAGPIFSIRDYLFVIFVFPLMINVLFFKWKKPFHIKDYL